MARMTCPAASADASRALLAASLACGRWLAYHGYVVMNVLINYS